MNCNDVIHSASIVIAENPAKVKDASVVANEVGNDIAELALAIWHGFEFFPNALPTAACQQYLLCLFFLRAVSLPATENNTAWPPCELGVPPEAQFSALFATREHPGNGARIDAALAALASANPHLLGSKLAIASFDSPLLGGAAQRDSLLSALLCHFAQEAFTLPIGTSDTSSPYWLGEVFSEVLRLFACYHDESTQFFTSMQNDIERDMTPRPVAQLMARLLDPMPNDAIYDPACGTGSLLSACGLWVKQMHQGEPRVLYGMELNFDRCALARMNLVLYGMDSTHLVYGDALAGASEETMNVPCPRLPDSLRSMLPFDVVLSAPPIVVHPDTVQQDASKGAENAAYIKPLKRAGLGFALTMLSRLQPNTGRMAVLLPVSALARCDQREMREELVRANAMDSVILLPPCLLQHYPEPAAIVLMRRSPDFAPVYIVDARQLGVNVEKLPANFAKPFLDQVMNDIAQAFLPKRDIPGLSRLVTWAELEQVKYDFTAIQIAESASSAVVQAQNLSPLLSMA